MDSLFLLSLIILNYLTEEAFVLLHGFHLVRRFHFGPSEYMICDGLLILLLCSARYHNANFQTKSAGFNPVLRFLVSMIAFHFSGALQATKLLH